MSGTETLDGKLLRQLLICGHNNLNSGINYLNEINVFPVSDGDTGNNMCRTFEMGVSELIVSSSFSKVLSSFVRGMLLGSRGNSGSILSQYFLGIHEATKDKDSVSPADFRDALKHACNVAYQAVLRPVEGTILTVMRESIDNTIPQLGDSASFEKFFEIYTAELYTCVQGTTNRLDILRLNNVVDSGAAGLFLVFDGIKNGLYKTDAPYNDHAALFTEKSAQSVHTPLNFRYCAEFLMKIKPGYPKEHFMDLLSAKGDSLIVTINDSLLKVHIHTNQPQNILDEFSAYGDFAETKVDDMLLQWELTQYNALHNKHDGYIIISFVHGDGIIKLFNELGCDIVFTATQDYHVDDDNFHMFIDKFINEEIILLPNDEKIYDTAVKLYPPSNNPGVHIINSPNVIMSYFLLSSMIGTDGIDKVLKTFASYKRSDFFLARILSVTIQREQYYVGFTAKETIINKSLGELLSLIDEKENVKSYTTIVAFHGQTARDKDIALVSSFLASGDGDDTDFAMLDGKQDDFDFIIGAM